MRCLRLAVQPNNLDNAHLQQLVHTRDLIEHLNDVLHSLGHGTIREEHESITLACRIRLSSKERLDQFRSVWDQAFNFSVYVVYRENGILADV